jgi:hypothetical protein
MIQDLYVGDGFFEYVSLTLFKIVTRLMVFHLPSDWDFYTGSDPTGGNVIYQNKSAAQSKGLAYVNDSDYSTVLAVDSTSTVAAGGDRDSCVTIVFTIIYVLIHSTVFVSHLKIAITAASLSWTPPKCLLAVLHGRVSGPLDRTGHMEVKLTLSRVSMIRRKIR